MICRLCEKEILIPETEFTLLNAKNFYFLHPVCKKNLKELNNIITDLICRE